MKIAFAGGNKHAMYKQLDAYEETFYLNTDLFLKHINNQPPFDTNPHDVVASQVGRDTGTSWWDTTDNVQLHTDNYNVHITYSEGEEQYTAANVNVILELDLGNTSVMQLVWVWVDGRKMGLGIDYMVTKATANGTI